MEWYKGVSKGFIAELMRRDYTIIKSESDYGVLNQAFVGDKLCFSIIYNGKFVVWEEYDEVEIMEEKIGMNTPELYQIVRDLLKEALLSSPIKEKFGLADDLILGLGTRPQTGPAPLHTGAGYNYSVVCGNNGGN